MLITWFDGNLVVPGEAIQKAISFHSCNSLNHMIDDGQRIVISDGSSVYLLQVHTHSQFAILLRYYHNWRYPVSVLYFIDKFCRQQFIYFLFYLLGKSIIVGVRALSTWFSIFLHGYSMLTYVRIYSFKVSVRPSKDILILLQMS